MLNFDAKYSLGPDCCVAMDWPVGSRQIAFVQTVISAAGNPEAPVRKYQLVYLDPATGAAGRRVVLCRGRNLDLVRLDFDPSGRYALFGLQSPRTVGTWWSDGGKPVRVNQTEIGDQALRDVAGAYMAGAW